jgi:Mg2+-importing ATPase
VIRDASNARSEVVDFHYWSQPREAVLAHLGSSPAGLSSDEAQRRLAQLGPNALKAERNISGLRTFLNQFRNPVVLILIFAALVSVFMAEWVDAAVIVVIVIGSAVLGFSQEYAASAAVAKLRARVRIHLTVLRDGK